MRGEERRQRALLMIMEPGDRVPREHPLRRVKELADAALAELSPLFDEMYSAIGRPSIPPQRLLKASLLMALHTARYGGYAVSQRVRKRVAEIFGWMKTVGGLRKTRYRGLDRTQLHAGLVAAAYNLLRIARRSPAPA